MATVSNRGRVRVGGATIEFEVRRSQRRKKTVQITLDREGGVRVAAPSTMSDSDVRKFVRKRASWIIEKRSENGAKAEPVRLVSGDGLPYLGRDVRLAVNESGVDFPEVHLDRRRLTVEAPSGFDGDARLELTRIALVAWYCDRASEYLSEAVDRWWPKLGRGTRSRILIGDQRSRWGSCAADGTLRFSWRAMMLEPMLIELIVVHELAHLSVRNHSADFWDVVEGALPDVSVRRKRLREVGRTLPL